MTMESTWEKFQKQLLDTDFCCEECDNGNDTRCEECLALEEELDTARAAVVDYSKGFNINDTEQVRQMALLKIKVQELEEKVTW